MGRMDRPPNCRLGHCLAADVHNASKALRDEERQASPSHGRDVIIYDFEGVIADSEVIANAVLGEMVTELGRPTTLADCYRLYTGKRSADAVAAIEAALGSSLPEGFAARYQARTLAHLQRDLRPVVGARQHIL